MAHNSYGEGGLKNDSGWKRERCQQKSAIQLLGSGYTGYTAQSYVDEED